MHPEKTNLLQLLHSSDPSNHLIAYQILKGNKDLQKELCDKAFISSLINSSQEVPIKIALLLIKRDQEISDWAKIRYAPLLDFLGINALNGLVAVPKKLLWVKEIARIEISLRNWGLSDSFAEYLAKLNIIQADLRSKSMKKLPDFLFKIPSLTRILVACGKMKELPDSWDKLPNLSAVFIKKNLLTSLPKSFGKLKQLNFLILSENRFTELPEVISNCKKLTHLDLTLNKKMTEFPEWLGDLKQLKILSFSDSKIRTFPSSFIRLKRLIALRLHNTPLAYKYNFAYSNDLKTIKGFIAKVVEHENEKK